MTLNSCGDFIETSFFGGVAGQTTKFSVQRADVHTIRVLGFNVVFDDHDFNPRRDIGDVLHQSAVHADVDGFHWFVHEMAGPVINRPGLRDLVFDSVSDKIISESPGLRFSESLDSTFLPIVIEEERE
jgi:hypothetical protein